MGCCGQKRAALRVRASVAAASPRTVTVEPRKYDTARLKDGGVMVEYRGSSTAVLHRSSSGRLYTFSPARPVRLLPAADAGHLLLNQDFRRIQY